MRTLLRAASVVVLGLALVACSPADDAPPSPSSAAGTGAATTAGAALDPAAFAERVAEPGAVVLDVRTPDEFAQGHLPGAVLMDVSDPDFADAVAELDPATPYALYCRTGSRSAQAVAVMLDAGITDVAHLDGGITAWSGEVVTD